MREILFKAKRVEVIGNIFNQSELLREESDE